MLTGIIRAPNRFSPFRHYARAIAERDTVLERMVKLQMVSEDEAAAAKRREIKVLHAPGGRLAGQLCAGCGAARPG